MKKRRDDNDNDEDDDNDEMMIVKKKFLIRDFRLYFVNIYTEMFEEKKYLENHFRELMKVLSMNNLYSDQPSLGYLVF